MQFAHIRIRLPISTTVLSVFFLLNFMQLKFQSQIWYIEVSQVDKSKSILFSVYADGRVCISILHAPGDDPMGYESSAERWSPVQSVEKILLSVVSMLAGAFMQYNIIVI